MSVTLFRRDGSEIGTGESVKEIVEENSAYLGGADLGGADLGNAYLWNANLGNANLGGADLGGADLGGANLGNAYLWNANLGNANLRGAYLGNANLGNAYLGNANLGNANLWNAYLGGADLGNAYLWNANLGNADLGGADLGNANLRNAKTDLQALHDHVSILPAGVLVGWKKAYAGDPVIVRLSIPADARRSNATGRKCRCDKATVVGMRLMDGTPFDGEAASSHDPDFKYRVGDVISVPDFDEDVWNECAPGIHFFITETEAREY